MAQSPLAAYASQSGVKYFLVSFVDLLGVSRSKLVPSSCIENAELKGAGFAGYATHFDMSPADPDLFAVPDFSSVIRLPWKPEVAWVASDLYMNGKVVEQCPRRVLKTQVEKAKRMGLVMKSGVECEFMLISKDNKNLQLGDKLDNAEKPCYEQGGLMRSYAVVTEILDCLEAMGWKPYQADHEDANGQFEINWEYDECLKTADRHAFFKFMVKSLAEKHGLRATFMPKPFLDQTGNGTHCHVSLWNTEGNLNLFSDSNGELGLSATAYEFIGGVLQNTKALTAILNPTVNSYKRIDGSTTLSGSSWAPCSISYTGNNRTHLIRIPEGDRFELRLADGAVNPYLFQAALLASGLQGIANHAQPGPRSDWNGYLTPPNGRTVEKLPTNLAEALHEFSKGESLRKELGEAFSKSYLKVQTDRWKSFTRHLSQWEIETTLDC